MPASTSAKVATTLLGPHTNNFSDPHVPQEQSLRVWYVAMQSTVLLISVATLREARLVLKTIAGLTGQCAPAYMGVQWYRSGQGWLEWAGSAGETIHDLPDDDVIFAPPATDVSVTH